MVAVETLLAEGDGRFGDGEDISDSEPDHPSSSCSSDRLPRFPGILSMNRLTAETQNCELNEQEFSRVIISSEIIEIFYIRMFRRIMISKTNS